MARPARLDDPLEHYPYKHQHARALVAENPRFGPNGPDDDAVETTDVLTPELVDLTAAYVKAQEVYVEQRTAGNLAAYRAARDELTEGRRRHRANRVDDQGRPTVGIIGIRAGDVATFKGA